MWDMCPLNVLKAIGSYNGTPHMSQILNANVIMESVFGDASIIGLLMNLIIDRARPQSGHPS